jgi:hypothetical protein
VVSPTQSLIFINMVRHYFTPGLAYTFYACLDPASGVQIFAYADLARLPELDFVAVATAPLASMATTGARCRRLPGWNCWDSARLP